MTAFKPLKNLEEVKEIKSGEMIGVRQSMSPTISSRCLNNDGSNIKLIGNMDDEVMIEYNFTINKIEGFYADGSIRINMDGQKFIKKGDEKFNIYKKFWGSSQK